MYSLTNLPNPQKDEKGVLILRRHWFTFMPVLGLYIFLGLIPIFILSLRWWQTPDTLTGPVSYPLTIIIVSIYYLSICSFLFQAFLDYYLDIWVVTTERIICLEQSGMFTRRISEQKLYRVQDVTSIIDGFFPTMLKYGILHVQTAGQMERFIFKNVHNPDSIVKTIHDLSVISKQKHPESSVEFTGMV